MRRARDNVDLDHEGEGRVAGAREEDNGEPGRGDRLGIRLENGYLVTARSLGGDGPGGGNVQLHKPNPSTTGPPPPPSEFEMCGDLSTPDASE